MPATTTRQIGGVLLRPDAVPFANVSLTILRDPRAATGQGGAVVVDQLLNTQTGSGGEVSMALLPGRYLGQVRLSDADRYFQFAVPDTTGPFLIGDLLTVTDVSGGVFMTLQDLTILARAWAEKPEDDPVLTGPDRFSALHHAAKATASAASALSAYQGRQYDTRDAFIADSAYATGVDAPSDGTVVTAGGFAFQRAPGANEIAGLPGWRFFGLNDAPTPFNSLRNAVGYNEAQRAIGMEPARVLYNANGTYIVDPRSHFPKTNYILLPASGSATLDCSGLYYNVPYEFFSGTGGTTVTLDFGADMFVRIANIPANDATVKSIALQPNSKVTITRVAGNQVFADFSAPPYLEGAWLPTVYGSGVAGTQSYGLQNGRWVLNGNLLTFHGTIFLSSTSGATGAVRLGISDLPFLPGNAANIFYSVNIPYWLNLTSPVSGGTTFGGADYIEVYRAAGGSAAIINAAELQNTTRFRFSGSYMI